MADEQPPQISIAWPQPVSPPPDLATALWNSLAAIIGGGAGAPVAVPVNPVSSLPLPAPAPVAGGDYGSIAAAFLDSLGLQDTDERRSLVIAWMRCEKPAGNPAQWNNPMNTTLRTAHSVGAANDLGNGIGVQIYDTLDAGIAANVSTVLESHFSPIVQALADADPIAFARAFDHTPRWGTSSACIRSFV